MKRSYLIIITILIVGVVGYIVNIQRLKQKRMIKFFVLNSKIARENQDRYALQGYEFINWYKSCSKEYDFSKSFCKKIFEQNSKINQVLTYNILNYNLLGPTDASNFVYFYLNAFFAKNIIDEINRDNGEISLKEELEKFLSLLEGVRNKNSFCIIEYSKKDGWFDYEDVLTQKKQMEERSRDQFK
jgi:hypothetical protein